jgi:hypothetical protein
VNPAGCVDFLATHTCYGVPAMALPRKTRGERVMSYREEQWRKLRTFRCQLQHKTTKQMMTAELQATSQYQAMKMLEKEYPEYQMKNCPQTSAF